MGCNPRMKESRELIRKEGRFATSHLNQYCYHPTKIVDCSAISY